MTSYFDGLAAIARTERTVETGLETVDAVYDAGRPDRVDEPAEGPGQVVHSFAYDALGRLSQASDPDVGVRDLIYDDRNLLASTATASGRPSISTTTSQGG